MFKQHRYREGDVEKDRTFRIEINKFILIYVQIIHEDIEEERLATAAIKTKVDGKTTLREILKFM